MRVLLAHNSLYFPSHGGGDKSNRLLMEALTARGHEVRVVARIEKFGEKARQQLVGELDRRGVQHEIANESVHFVLRGVDVYTLTLNPNLRAYFSAQLTAFDPDVIITSTDDPGLLLFDLARRASRARVVYLVRATIAVPFGPDSSMSSSSKTEMLRHADGIVGVSEYVAGYVRKWSGLDAVHVPISLMEPGEFHNLGRFDNPYAAMVNPCAVKGIGMFLALAERMPRLQFAAVPTWGTSAQDLAELRRVPNIAVLEAVDDIENLLRKTRVVLVPSVWAEARSRMVVEAMLRGVPVIASDAGGIREAKLGVPYLLPVNLITRYRPTLDENMVPVAEVPPQDIGPWETALHRLTSDRAHWDEVAAQSRAAAIEYARTLNVEPFERFLIELVGRSKKQRQVANETPQLSEDKKRLLALRLKQRSAAQPPPIASAWFPSLDVAERAKLRLFCFPHAGAGTLAYRLWIGRLERVTVIPVLLPGRETRLAEPAIDDMQELIGQLSNAILPFVDVAYSFFGHSMGAGIAFELARSLRRAGVPGPKTLIVSAARAPQLRCGPPIPEPSDEELIEQLRRLEGVPQKILEDRESLNLALPLLRADTRLYRNYRYEPDRPLEIHLVAYGGALDPNVAPQDLDAWRERTSASFIRREFPGGHFYFQMDPAAFLAALRHDLLNPL